MAGAGTWTQDSEPQIAKTDMRPEELENMQFELSTSRPSNKFDAMTGTQGMSLPQSNYDKLSC